MNRAVWAVVVARSGPAGKTRLAEALTVEQRAALVGAMLADVLRATSGARLAGTVAVLDPGQARDGVLVLPDTGAGLDAAVEAGVRAAADRGAESVVVLPGDVPLLQPEDIQALADAAASASRVVVVVPDRHGTGTNALALRPPTVIAPSFGPGSAARHLAAARAAGALARTLEVPRLALDIDTPEDLAELWTRSPGGITHAELRRMTGILLELHVPDLEVARAFYGLLGFETAREETPGAEAGYLVLSRGPDLICFWGGTPRIAEHRFFGRRPADTPRGQGVEIVIPVEDLDAMHDALRATGRVVEPPRRRAWGARDFRVEDPFGYYLRITEPHDPRTTAGPRQSRRPQASAAADEAPQRQ